MKARKLKSGNWNIRIMVGGKSYSFTDPDKKVAKKQASAFAAEVRENIQNPPLYKCLEDFITERSETLSPSTLRAYESIVRAIRKRNPTLAQKRVVALTDKDVQDIIRPLKTPKTQRNYVNFIQVATDRRFKVKYHNQKQKHIAIPTELEIAGLVEVFRNTEMEIPIMLGAYGGLRRGEICALRMADIDGDFVHVSKAVVRDQSGTWVTKDPKTASSIRSVLLPHFVIERIQEQGYITHLLPSQVSNRFWKKQRNLGIPPYCFHSLRHFHASYLHYLNIPDAYIQKRGGWANASTLQNIYRHALADKVTPTDIFAVSAFQNPFQ